MRCFTRSVVPFVVVLGTGLAGCDKAEHAPAENAVAAQVQTPTAPAEVVVKPSAAASLADARTLWGQGETEEALASFAKAVELAPKDAAVASELGFAQFRAGNLDAAEATLNAALALVTEADAKVKGSILYNLGRVAEAKGDSKAAAAHYRASLKERPNDTVAARLQAVESPAAKADGAKAAKPVTGKVGEGKGAPCKIELTLATALDCDAENGNLKTAECLAGNMYSYKTSATDVAGWTNRWVAQGEHPGADAAPTPLTKGQAVPASDDVTFAYTFDAKGRAETVTADPTADANDYTYKYSYDCK